VGIADGDVLRCFSRAAGSGADVSLLPDSAAWQREEKRLQFFYKRETNAGQMICVPGAQGLSVGLRRIHEAEVGSGVT
jgi:hypothetical protein